MGIDSVYAPPPRRLAAWEALAKEVDGSTIDSIVKDISLEQAIPAASALLAGEIAGRVIVNLAR